MKKTIIIAMSLVTLCSGCGSIGFSIGMNYNDFGITFDIKGDAPQSIETTTEDDAELL